MAWRRGGGFGWSRDPQLPLVRYEIEMALYAAALLERRSKVPAEVPDAERDEDEDEAIRALLAFPPVRWWR